MTITFDTIIFVEFLAAITAIVVLLTAVITLLTNRKVDQTQKEVNKIHILVNSKMTAALERIDQLANALVEADEPIPKTGAPHEL